MKRSEENKVLEKKQDYKLESFNYIVRLDGKGFSKFTKKFFEKPYDPRLDDIFQNITESLFKEFKVKFAYTQSDEITLVFDNSNKDFFNWRIQKIVSLLAGKASSLLIKELYKKDMIDAVDVSPCFDARVFEIYSDEDLYKSLEFRYFDCLRNGRLNLAMFLPKKDRLNKSGMEIIQLVKEFNGYDYFELPLSYRKGTFFRKIQVEKENPYNKEEKVIRNVVEKFNIDNYPSCEEFYNVFKLESSFN